MLMDSPDQRISPRKRQSRKERLSFDDKSPSHALRNRLARDVPETVAELVTHYRKYELTEESKAFATIEANTLYLVNHIVPKWGTMYLQDVRTVDVETWLHTLVFAPGTQSKIRNIMPAVFKHAIRQEWMERNPITKVRQHGTAKIGACRVNLA